MLVTRLKPEESIVVGGSTIRNLGGSPIILGIEGPDKVKLRNMQDSKTQKFVTIPLPR